MLFTIVNGKPYLMAADGTTYAVMIDGNNVTIGEAVSVEITGKYTLREIQAKCTDLNSFPERKSKKTVDENEVAAEPVKTTAKKTKKSKE